MTITIQTRIRAPLADVWARWTTPADVMQWNAASDDWHTTAATVDLRVGGEFNARMEAKDGSEGFDFAGTYTEIVLHRRIASQFGDRTASVTFDEGPYGVTLTQTFDPETTHPLDMQRAGWQAILDRFAAYVHASQPV